MISSTSISTRIAAAIAAAVVILCQLAPVSRIEAAYLEDVPQVLEQPDGTRIECLASGDEYYHWLHDEDGFVIVRDPESGYWVWAEKSRGQIVASRHVVGRVPPTLVGLEPRILPDRDHLKSDRLELFSTPPVQPAPSTGTMENLVVFIRFSDETEFTQTISAYDSAFNSTAAGASSMKAYFKEVSYDRLTINSTFYPDPPGPTVVSYQDGHPRAYYQPFHETENTTGYTSENKTDREHTLLKNAIEAIASQVPGTLDIDGDDDGLVDNVVFFISGSPTGWSDLLWPHRWVLWSKTATINGKRVWDYNFQLSSWLGVGVLCHEMFHSLGAPDLYHYYTNTSVHPAGRWDVMNINMDPPQHMTSYMKMRYGEWIDEIPEITATGTYTLNPVTSSTNNAYKIASPNTLNEYFVVEYRRKTGTFEGSVPGSGLIVYRINTAADGYGNKNGPPDELYIYRPGGSDTVNGSPDDAHLSLDVGRTQINDSTNPSSFLSDNSNGGLDISDVGSPGDTISFTVTVSIPDDFRISVSPSSQAVCRGSNAEFAVTISQIGLFTGPVTLSSGGRPVSTTSTFSPNPVAATPGTSTYTVGNTINASAGTSTITVTGTGSSGVHNDSVSLTILPDAGVASLVAPANGAVNQTTTPTFAWGAVAGATSYTIQVDDDANFSSPVHTAVVQSTTYSGASLDQGATYYWRIFASNTCGLGSPSPSFSLSTTDGSTVCSNVLLEPGFEGGSQSAWSESSTHDWPLVDTYRPRTGTYSSWLGGGDSETSLIWQSAPIDAAASSATLSYWYSISSQDSCGWDDGGLEINGTPADGHTYDLCATTNTAGGWIQSGQVDLLALAGTSPDVQFSAATDGSNPSSLWVDDVVLEVCVPGAPPDGTFADGFESGDASAWTSVTQ